MSHYKNSNQRKESGSTGHELIRATAFISTLGISEVFYKKRSKHRGPEAVDIDTYKEDR